ncbi:hypothetical protein HZF02_15565 [Pseudomonas yamanorum]|nr:hypothetical protein HZF02_15565 [Pseudomonas yamanorum]
MWGTAHFLEYCKDGCSLEEQTTAVDCLVGYVNAQTWLYVFEFHFNTAPFEALKMNKCNEASMQVLQKKDHYQRQAALQLLKARLACLEQKLHAMNGST